MKEILHLKKGLNVKKLFILTWSELRAGISVALALPIPTEYNKEIWVTITYVIVCFSILVHVFTIGKMTKKHNIIQNII